MISDNNTYLHTGNEFITISNINTSNAGIGEIGFIHNGFRACVELRGPQDCPLLQPTVKLDGEELFDGKLEAEQASYWIPSITAASPKLTATAMVFAPLERRGFACVLTLRNNTDRPVQVEAGWTGCWESSHVTANISRLLSGTKHGSLSSWHEGVPVIEFRGQTPLFAMALVSQEIVQAEIWDAGEQCKIGDGSKESVSANSGEAIHYKVVDKYIIEPNGTLNIPIYVGIGLEEVSSVASARELRLQGWDRMLKYLKAWLDKHTIECDDPYFQRLININSFYNYFYSQGITLDTEELIMTASRSSLNDHCGAYLDRDALRWSLPAILQISWAQARKALTYAFTQQLKNVGVHTRFIDGIVLEPGLQLDQLCAPIRALTLYVQLTGDMSVVFDRRVQVGVNTIQQILAAQRHPDVALFETLLLPSEEPSRLPYVCFSNILVWRVLCDIGWLYDRIRDLDRAAEAIRLANQVRAAIMEHFVVDGPNGKMFAQAIDLEGHHLIGDEPAGSLQMMTYFEFCAPSDPVYKNTVAWIHSDMNPQSGAGHPFAAPPSTGKSGPSVLSVANDLLTGRKDVALDFLRRATLDNGIACETVDANTGRAVGGRAFASGAGYLAFSLRLALNAMCPPTAVVEQKRRPSETLYEPPPETSQDTKKARM